MVQLDTTDLRYSTAVTSTVTVADSNQSPFNESLLSFASYIWIRVLHLIQCIVYIPVECTVLFVLDPQPCG